MCSREFTNVNDRNAVAMVKTGTTIGHVSRKICKVCSDFLRISGLISCKVTGIIRCFSHDMPHGENFQ